MSHSHIDSLQYNPTAPTTFDFNTAWQFTNSADSLYDSGWGGNNLTNPNWVLQDPTGADLSGRVITISFNANVTEAAPNFQRTFEVEVQSTFLNVSVVNGGLGIGAPDGTTL